MNKKKGIFKGLADRITAPNESEEGEIAGEKVRSKVEDTFTGHYRTKGLSEKKMAILKLENNYISALETLEFYGLLNSSERPPDFEQIVKLFTPEMLKAAENFQDGRLILSPKGISFNDLASAISAKGPRVREYKLYNDDHAERPLDNWGAYIVDGVPKMPLIHEFDSQELTIRERLQRFDEYKKAKKIGGMDRWKYALLMMLFLKGDGQIDKHTSTLLDSDPATSIALSMSHPFPVSQILEKKVEIPQARFNVRALSFGSVSSEYRPFRRDLNDNMFGSRFRRSVGSEIPNI